MKEALKLLHFIMKMVLIFSLRPNTIVFLSMGLTKSRVNMNNPQNLEQQKTNIHEVMADILPEICRKVIGNHLKLIDYT